MIYLLEICWKKEELANIKSWLEACILQQQPSIVMEAHAKNPKDLPPFDQQAFLAGIPKSVWGKALELYEVTANRFFACGKDSHYMRDCPSWAQGTPVN